MKAIVTALFCLLFFGSMPESRAQRDPAPASYYFGHIEAPCHPNKDRPIPGKNKTSCEELKEDIHSMGTACETIDGKCEQGERILRKLFGNTYRDTLPDLLLYLEQKVVREKDGKPVLINGKPLIAFTAHRPVLMWQNRNTPHLYGVRDVYPVVFSERKACIDAFISTDYKSEPNPFSAILAIVGKNIDPDKAKEEVRKKIEFSWHPLDGNPRTQGMWYAVARVSVDVNSTNRLTVRYKQPKSSDDGDKDKKEAQAGAKPKPKPKPQPQPEPGLADECGAEEGEEAPVYTADFIGANAFFSNSPDSRVTVALALGMTSNVRGTSLASGGSNQSFNGYALAKFYAIRPQLRAGPEGTGHRMSLGGFVGTNISGSAFDQLVLGISVGHVIGNVGFVAGLNSIKGIEGSEQGRKWRSFVGLDYSF